MHSRCLTASAIVLAVAIVVAAQQRGGARPRRR